MALLFSNERRFGFEWNRVKTQTSRSKPGLGDHVNQILVRLKHGAVIFYERKASVAYLGNRIAHEFDFRGSVRR